MGPKPMCAGAGIDSQRASLLMGYASPAFGRRGRRWPGKAAERGLGMARFVAVILPATLLARFFKSRF